MEGGLSFYSCDVIQLLGCLANTKIHTIGIQLTYNPVKKSMIILILALCAGQCLSNVINNRFTSLNKSPCSWTL